MQQEIGETAFKILFAQATGMYPNSGGHEASVPAYWAMLRSYSAPVLREAVRRACMSSPQFFPSAVRIRECAEAASKTAQLPKPLPPQRQLEDKREHVPLIGAGAEQWITEAEAPCDRLARMWQVESKANGWDRGKEMPTEDGKRRWKELSAAFETQTAAAEKRRQNTHRSNQASTSGAPRTASGSESGTSGSSESRQSSGSSADELSDGAW